MAHSGLDLSSQNGGYGRGYDLDVLNGMRLAHSILCRFGICVLDIKLPISS